MASEAEAVIYLANQRGCYQTDWFRSYYTFNIGEFKRESRAPFGSLVAVNEHTLKEGRTLSLMFEEKVKVLLLPIEGELIYKSANVENVVDVGQVSYIISHPGIPLEITNRYTSRLINFIQISVRIGDEVHSNLHHVFSFDLESDSSQLVPLSDLSESSTDELFFIGKFRGRQKIVFQTRKPDSGIFAYEIAGTCEVHERLLLPGDALSIKNAASIGLEALTHEAIVLIAEVPMAHEKGIHSRT
ncbi:MAG TPA: hypothetical protein VK589_25785 [Chryseolinea sp.]|nr:hypothetical protein [Chryseolinea sp.]